MQPPAIGRFDADPRWRAIDLLSDVHLHAAMPRTFDAWRRHMLDTPADAVLILGDLFEVWVGDDARGDGLGRDAAHVLAEAAAQRCVAFLPGNRDFLVGDALLRECGVQGLSDPTLLTAWDQQLLLTHGDALCLADHDYQRFRAEVRGPVWRERFLAQPLARREAQARAMRDASSALQATMSPESWADVDDEAACDWLRATGATTLVHGHTHRPAQHALPCGATRHVLGDWDFDSGVPRALALRLTPQGLQRLDLAVGA